MAFRFSDAGCVSLCPRQRLLPASRRGMGADFELTFLGTGTSVGVPVIGCDCPVCTSGDPRNNRTRASIHVRLGGVGLLVDSGPDLREQALREKLTRLDAVVYTHGHADHVVGFDELRAFCWHRDSPLPLHATPGCMATLRTMFGWAFQPENQYRGYVKPDPRIIDGPFALGALEITPLPVLHASVETVGFLFSAPGAPSTAYLPDVKVIPGATRDLIRGVDILIIDALRPGDHPTHMSLPEALATIDDLSPARAWLTHLGHENDHAALADSLPERIGVAWDGLRIRA